MTTLQPEVSASQLDLLKLCGWRWYFSYIENRKEPFAESAQAGTIVHDRIEKHLLGEKRVDPKEVWLAPSGYEYQIGQITVAMLKNIPWGFGELTKDQLETKLRLFVDDIVFTGRVDLRVGNQVWDQKTTSNLRNAKSEEDLKEDVQALVYAKWALDKNDAVDLTWNYGQAKNEPNTKKTRLTLLRSDIEERFENIVMPLAREAQAAYRHKDITKLVRNEKACFKFPPNGCPNKVRCAIVKEKVSRMEKKLSLFEKIKQEQASNENTVEPERAAVVAADIAAIAAVQAANASAAPPAFDPINSPEGQLRAATPPPPEPVVTDTLPKKPRKKREPAELKVEVGDKEHASASNVGPVEQLVEIVREAYPEKHTNAPLEEKPIKTLFVQCMPLNKNVKFAHEFIARASQTVENDLEIHHVLLAPYSTGGASLAAQLRADILSLGESDFDLVLLNRSPEGRNVEQVLISLSKNVVMGL